MENASPGTPTLKNLQVEADGSVTQTFLHGVNLNDTVLVHNIGVAGRLLSADFVGRVDRGIAKTHRPIGSVPISELAAGGPRDNAVSPRVATYLIPTGILESGQKIFNGYGEPWELTIARRARLKETRDIELEFEKVRRQIAPSAPSRLTCFWLAENSGAGRSVILKMMPYAYIAQARVNFCQASLVVDAGWFDDYLNYPKPEYVESYWTCRQHPKHSMPETLVDGHISFDPADCAYIKENGKQFNY